MRSNKQDILDVLGVSYKEDAFANILKFLFDGNNDFRRSFIDFIGGSLDNLDKYIFQTRTKYNNVIPDIVIYNYFNQELDVIEVKLFSKEGKNQLLNYDKNLDCIYSEIYQSSVSADNHIIENKIKLHYLTIDETISNSKIKVNCLYWKDLYPFIKNIVPKENSLDEIFLKSLFKRLEPLVNIPELTYNNIISSKGWSKNYMILKKIIEDNVKNGNLNDMYSVTGYGDYEKNNGVNTSTIILRESNKWISEFNMIDFRSKIKSEKLFKECYDFHIEIEVYPKENNIHTVYRFDLHANDYNNRPRKTNKDAESVKYFSDRLKFIKDVQDNSTNNDDKYPYVDIYKNSKYKYNKRNNNNYLFIFKTEKEYTKDEFINFEKDLIETINEMLPYCNEVIDSFHSLV